MTHEDIDEAIWRVIAARLAHDVLTRTDAEDIGEDVVKRHCMVAVGVLRHGIRDAYIFRESGAKDAVKIQYQVDTL